MRFPGYAPIKYFSFGIILITIYIVVVTILERIYTIYSGCSFGQTQALLSAEHAAAVILPVKAVFARQLDAALVALALFEVAV